MGGVSSITRPNANLLWSFRRNRFRGNEKWTMNYANLLLLHFLLYLFLPPPLSALGPLNRLRGPFPAPPLLTAATWIPSPFMHSHLNESAPLSFPSLEGMGAPRGPHRPPSTPFSNVNVESSDSTYSPSGVRFPSLMLSGIRRRSSFGGTLPPLRRGTDSNLCYWYNVLYASMDIHAGWMPGVAMLPNIYTLSVDILSDYQNLEWVYPSCNEPIIDVSFHSFRKSRSVYTWWSRAGSSSWAGADNFVNPNRRGLRHVEYILCQVVTVPVAPFHRLFFE